MIRSLIVIALAIVCGGAAAIGVNQFITRRAIEQAQQAAVMNPVFVCKNEVRRGEVITAEMVEQINWQGAVPKGMVTTLDEVVNKTAVTTIMAGEPIFNTKVANVGDASLVSTLIDKNMRAYTIQTKGPSASVANLVRPGDHVDVLLNLRGGANDETGGGSATTLLQNVEILAIDQILDPTADRLKVLEMWAKGDNFTSVTLKVSPQDATLLFLGQSNGELSLALRNTDDADPVNTNPATIRQIRFLQMSTEPDATSGSGSDDTGNTHPPAPFRNAPVADAIPGQKRAPDAYIHTLRGDQVGRVPVAVNR